MMFFPFTNQVTIVNLALRAMSLRMIENPAITEQAKHAVHSHAPEPCLEPADIVATVLKQQQTFECLSWKEPFDCLLNPLSGSIN